MKTNRIVIIDYGVGNIRSVENAFGFLGYDCIVSRDARDIRQAACLILPGVGAFAEGIKNLKDLNLVDVLDEAVNAKKKPILGICLGMQLLADSSEEGGMHRGLGYISGSVVKFPKEKAPRIPHVGWNTLSITKEQPLFERSDSSANYYFDHSYYFVCAKKHVLASCTYGTEFAAAVGEGNIYGVQFHPEKSQANGLKLFRSFFSRYNL